MKKRSHFCKTTLFILLAATTSSQAIFKETLDEFIVRITPDKAEQEGFRAYYSNFLDRQSRLSTKRKRRKLRRLREDGLASLQIKHAKQYKMLADHSELDLDGQSRNTRLFLVRYRLFEDFKANKNTKREYLWNKTKTIVADLGKKAVHFGKTIKNKVAAYV